MHNWKEIHRAQEEYLSNNKNYTIIQTRLKQSNCELDNMRSWCEKNVKGSWSVAQLEEYNYNITFRIWDEKAAIHFRDAFNPYIIDPE